jgi:hypothetical protein
MHYETQWAGDAIAAPICSSYDREDAFFESRDDRPTNLSGLALMDQLEGFDRCATVVGNASRTRAPPYELGLGKGRRPNAEGHRSFPLRDRVWE